MNQERFSFLELSSEEGPLTAPGHFSVPEIPDGQHLNYLDLLAMKPTPALLKRVSRRLIEKYQFVPLLSAPAQLPPRLPNRLDPQFHLRWKCESAPQICYLAMVYPKQQLVLQLVHNAIGQGLYILPILPDTFSRFMGEKYDALSKG